MATPRQLYVDKLTAAFAGPPVLDYGIEAYSRQIAGPSKTTVMVRLDGVAPSPHALGAWDYTVTLVLIGAKTTPGPADDEVDAAAIDVLHALEKNADGIRWTNARRSSYGEPDPTNPAYEITTVITVTKE